MAAASMLNFIGSRNIPLAWSGITFFISVPNLVEIRVIILEIQICLFPQNAGPTILDFVKWHIYRYMLVSSFLTTCQQLLNIDTWPKFGQSS